MPAVDPFPSGIDADGSLPSAQFFCAPPPLPRIDRRNRIRAWGCLVLAFLTCTVSGYGWDLIFRASGGADVAFPGEFLTNPLVLLRGLPYAITLLLILGAHEMGHFLACRRHGIPSTPPFLLPFPSIPVFMQTFGTLGAFIRIKSPFLDRRQLFDVGAAGPLAGIVVAVPAFLVGLSLSVPDTAPTVGESILFGDCVLSRLSMLLFFPRHVDMVVMHPIGWAAFFGFLATSLNLLPAGQLDGGHVVYALFGPSASWAVEPGCSNHTQLLRWLIS